MKRLIPIPCFSPPKLPHFIKVWGIALIITLSQIPAIAQSRPCNDTTVRIFDSICEGDTYSFNGRSLDHSGIFYDTVPRTDTICDSIIILKLSVLVYPSVAIHYTRHCRNIVGYDLFGGFPQVTYYQWSSQPTDSTLFGQEHGSWVRVNPKTPTTYTLILDYRSSTPQCPDTSTVKINPIEPVVASMHAEPDEITYDNMHIIAEDFSIGTREAHWDGWAGRNWYINGIRQTNNSEWVEFYVDPSWGDTIELMMEAYTPTCLDTAYKIIPFQRVSLYFPNVFTPDAENNNLFYPRTGGVLEYEIWIYDRRGALIFHGNDSQSWDGTTSHGEKCPMGTYVYRCRYRDRITPSGYNSTHGTVTLLR